MKKLMSILASAALISGAAGTVVACTGKYEREQNGNSILAYLTINGKKVAIDSSHVLMEMINESGPTNRNKFILDILKILNTSFFVNAEEFQNSVEGKTEYQNDNMVKALSDRYVIIKEEAERQISEERKKYKEDYGKKATAKWYEMLEAKFKGITDRDELDAKYFQSIIIGGSKNTTSELIDMLLNSNQLTYTFKNRLDIINQEMLDLRTYVAKGKTVSDYYKDESKASKVLLLWNASGQAGDAFAQKIEDVSESAFTSHFDLEEIDTKLILNNAPTDASAYARNTTARGMISNSQRFFIDKYFNYQKPVALSEITFPFDTNQKFEDGITADDFGVATDKTSELGKNINQFLEGKTNASIAFWDDALDATIPSGTAKRYDTLLTLDASTEVFSNTLRTAVYEYLSTNKSPSAATNGADLVAKINRNAADKVYTVLDDGIIAFAETDGLHFVRIEGYNFLKEATWNSKDGTGAPGTNDKELAAFDDFWNNKNDSERIAAMRDTTSQTYKNLNSNIKNEYLKFLLNSSLTKGLTGSKTQFDLMSQIKNYVKIEEPSAGEGTYVWWTAILEYFEYMMQAPETSNPEKYNEVFLGKFLTFGDAKSENSVNDIALKMQDWFISHIGSAKSTAAGTPLTTHAENQKAWEKTTKSSVASGTGYPEHVVGDNIDNIIASKRFGLPENMTTSATEESKILTAGLGYEKMQNQDFNIYYNNNSYAVFLGGKW
ncbi:hypothetical protein SSABA_v1c06340 [Spiroplasma sabaudiense Ar-1343]|uniref:Lipoprotein n=1 Tax=Spiroplasma sabaudiense Ar-1343 TaxID=1276257 RepID=W6AAJ7_9MOLU|nr:hypothetical protein [Spiroplasma sabaudiense]AHI54036.1 hypothetical protein SSABA_v1c06340 [Spiroplasma sabaudiense Ar-1343]